MNQELALEMVADLKAELTIPEETCPLIDSVLQRVKVALECVNNYHDHATAAENLQQIGPLMELIRKDNRALRELGAEWYKMASDFSYQFESESE